MTSFLVEPISDAHTLFYRVHVDALVNGLIRPEVFKEQDGAMSTDWQQYSSPQETFARATKPAKNGVIELLAGDVGLIEGLTVKQDPIPVNRAQTAILGIELQETTRPKAKIHRTRVRKQLYSRWKSRATEWLIRPQLLQESQPS